jgi:hypothetical protein
VGSPIPVLDHLIYAVPDLEAGIADFEARLGAVPLHGGRHALLGTWNAILPLTGGDYVELIAADPGAPEPAGPRPFGLDGLAAARLVTWAARSTDLDADVAAARARGYDPGLVIPVGRDTPDGERLEWRLTIAPEPAPGGLVPFLIDWGDAAHPSSVAAPVCRIEDFAGVSPDPDGVRLQLDALDLKLPLEVGTPAHLRATLVGPAGEVLLQG